MSAEDARLVILVKEIAGFSETWEVDVWLDGENVGSGTGGSVGAVLDVASSILYGDDNDHLNDDRGALVEHGISG